MQYVCAAAVIAALGTAPLHAASTAAPLSPAAVEFPSTQQIVEISAMVWLAKNDKANGNSKAKKVKPDTPGRGNKTRPQSVKAQKPAKVEKPAKSAKIAPEQPVVPTYDDQVVYARNCPPGLAKKNPPCVPPGLAKKGVTAEEWAGYGTDDYETLWLDRRTLWLQQQQGQTLSPLLLSSDQVAQLYGLPRAPSGQQYGLIDGMPVLLDEQDYASLLLVNELAQATGIGSGVNIAPTAVLPPYELQRRYGLPPLGADQNYAVLNGQIVRLTDSQYETLQLIRIARAVL